MKIKLSKKQIARLKKMDVLAVYLFGSYAQERYIHSLSDVDIGIVLEKPEKHKDNTLDIYSRLYDIFEEALPKDYLRHRSKLKKHEFDIVFLQLSPISLQFEAIKEGKVLYEKNKEKRLDYEEYVMKRHCDLEYIYNLFDKALLERI